MSKIGKKPIALPAGVTIKTADQKNRLAITGPKGELALELPVFLNFQIKQEKIFLTAAKNTPRHRAQLGLFRALLNNAVTGVNTGFEKKLEIQGVGYTAQVAGDKLTFNLGFSHPIEMTVPANLTVSIQKNIITVSGIDKQQVGSWAAQIKALRKPDPYKGKGIRYLGEQIIRKQGKVAKTVGAA